MFVLRCIVCGLALIATMIIAPTLTEFKTQKGATIAKYITYLLIGGFCLLLITTNWNVWAIPKIILFLTGCLIIYDCFAYSLFFWHDLTKVGCWLTIIAYFVVTVFIYPNSVTQYKDYERGYWTLVSATDGSSVAGSISGGLWYVRGTISEEPEYVYYYKMPDGGIKQGRVPADKTTIYYIEDAQPAYLERLITETYYSYNSQPLDDKNKHNSSFETTYNLYVPQGSVIQAYEFDTQ